MRQSGRSSPAASGTHRGRQAPHGRDGARPGVQTRARAARLAETVAGMRELVEKEAR
jgi:hypothetical protein